MASSCNRRPRLRDRQQYLRSVTSGCEQDNVNGLGLRPPAHFLTDSNTIHPGHHPIENRYPWSIVVLKDLSGFNSIRTAENLVSPFRNADPSKRRETISSSAIKILMRSVPSRSAISAGLSCSMALSSSIQAS